MAEVIRKFRLAEFFHNKDERDDSLVRNKCHFIPPKNRNQSLDNFITNVENIPLDNNSIQNNIKTNITNAERNAIKSLSSDKTIVIKEADKGGAVVVMDATHYKEMANNILEDPFYYNKIQNSPGKINHINYIRLLDKHSHCLREKELKYLKDFEIKESQFYGLPKIHKSKQIMKKCEAVSDSCIHIYNVNDLKLRPIIAGPACLTNRLSNLLDIILKPLIKNVPSFLRDTTDFFNKLPSTTQENTILVSFDVESLYSNICHDLGLKAITYWLDNL